MSDRSMDCQLIRSQVCNDDCYMRSGYNLRIIFFLKLVMLHRYTQGSVIPTDMTGVDLCLIIMSHVTTITKRLSVIDL